MATGFKPAGPRGRGYLAPGRVVGATIGATRAERSLYEQQTREVSA